MSLPRFLAWAVRLWEGGPSEPLWPCDPVGRQGIRGWQKHLYHHGPECVRCGQPNPRYRPPATNEGDAA